MLAVGLALSASVPAGAATFGFHTSYQPSFSFRSSRFGYVHAPRVLIVTFSVPTYRPRYQPSFSTYSTPHGYTRSPFSPITTFAGPKFGPVQQPGFSFHPSPFGSIGSPFQPITGPTNFIKPFDVGPQYENKQFTFKEKDDGYCAPSEVPLPAGLPLFATGLGVLGVLRLRRRRAA